MFDGIINFFKRYGESLASGGLEGGVLQGLDESFKFLQSKIPSLKADMSDLTPFGQFSYWDKITKTIKDTNQSLGVAGQLGMSMESSFQDSLVQATNLGLEFSAVAAEYKAFISDIGRNRELTSEEMIRLAEVKAVYGEGATEIFAAFDNLGVSIADTSEGMQQSALRANKMGLNSLSVIKELKTNIGAINKYNFEGGRKGLERMAELAVKTKISMSSVLGMSDNIWKGGIEGAIEMGSSLQMLGGKFAEMGDPTELFYKARNDPKAFMESIQDATASVAHFNETTGEISINALGRSQLRELEKITSIPLEQLAESARTARKELEMEGLFDSSIKNAAGFEDVLTKVAGAARMVDGEWKVSLGGVETAISKLNQGNIGQLDVVGKDATDTNTYEKIVTSNEEVTATMNKLIETLKLTMIPKTIYNAADKTFKESAEPWRKGMAEGDFGMIGNQLKALIDGAAENFAKVLTPLLKGDIVGAGQASLGNLTTGISGTVDWVRENVYEGSMLETAVNTISPILNGIWETLKLLLTGIGIVANNILWLSGKVIGGVGSIIGGAFDAAKGTWDFFSDALGTSSTNQTGNQGGTAQGTRFINASPIDIQNSRGNSNLPSAINTVFNSGMQESTNNTTDISHTISIKSATGEVITEVFTSKQWSAIKNYVIQLVNGDNASGGKSVSL